MTGKFSISFKGEFIEVLSDGDKDIEFALKLWTAVSEACEQRDCYKVLGIANTAKPLDTFDGFGHAELFQDLNLLGRLRIAWVEQNTSTLKEIYFVETVLRNRGAEARLFEDVQQAKSWLLD